jgi:hypothetical protein
MSNPFSVRKGTPHVQQRHARYRDFTHTRLRERLVMRPDWKCADEFTPAENRYAECAKATPETATYNVTWLNGRLRAGFEWLQQARPHIGCLQELKTDDYKSSATAIEDAGYGAIRNEEGARHGVATLPEGEPPREIRRGVP